MRNLLILFLLLVIVQSLIAQDFEKGEYFEVPIHEKYVGTWQGVNNHDTLIIILERYKLHESQLDIYLDMIGGWYKYVEGGIIRHDFLDLAGSYDDAVMVGFFKEQEGKLRLSMNNPKWWKPRETAFKLSSENPSRGILKLFFSREISAWIRIGDQEEVNPITTPSEWIMTKVE